jgi:hypothetical protein
MVVALLLLRGVAITRTRYQQLANGHLNCLFNRRGHIRRRLARSTGKKYILNDLRDEPVLCFHRNLCAAKRYLSAQHLRQNSRHEPVLHILRKLVFDFLLRLRLLGLQQGTRCNP